MKICALIFLTVMVVLENVSSWTTDLPEVRRQYFSKNIDTKDTYGVDITDGLKPFDNISPDIPLNTHEYYQQNSYDSGRTNRDYYRNSEENYSSKDKPELSYKMSYMEKKITRILNQGPASVEGLKRSLQDHISNLERCGRLNVESGKFNESTLQFELPVNLDAFLASWFTNFTERCANLTRKSEYVRSQARLALWVVNELLDAEYSSLYRPNEVARGHKDYLVTKLASFLDNLVRDSGFEPDPEPYVTTEKRPSEETPGPFSLMAPVSLDIMQKIMDCIKNASNEEPATERCQFPLEILSTFAEVSGTSAASSQITTIAEQSAILPNTNEKPPKVSTRSVQKRSDNVSPQIINFDTDKLRLKTISKRAFGEHKQFYLHKMAHLEQIVATKLEKGKLLLRRIKEYLAKIHRERQLHTLSPHIELGLD